MYLETLYSQGIHVAICVDTSGSVGNNDLAEFLAEVNSIQHCSATRVSLYYADTALTGPFILQTNSSIPAPVGGGGTDFRPFFKSLQHNSVNVAIYITDGFGNYPDTSPGYPVLWLITKNGIGTESIPFGRAIKLS